jgi:hypothetical protein
VNLLLRIFDLRCRAGGQRLTLQLVRGTASRSEDRIAQCLGPHGNGLGPIGHDAMSILRELRTRPQAGHSASSAMGLGNVLTL